MTLEPVTLREAARTPAVNVIRHAHTSMNAGGSGGPERIRGWLDVHLSPDGVREAEQVAEKLLAFEFDSIHSGNLRRAVETATIIGQYQSLAPHLSNEWRPWNLGFLQGQYVETAAPVIAHYARFEPLQPVPGGESYTEVRQRFFAGLSRLLMGFLGNPDRSPLLVTHYRNLKFLQGWDARFGKDWGTASEVDIETFLADDMPTCAMMQLLPGGGGRWHARMVDLGVGVLESV